MPTTTATFEIALLNMRDGSVAGHRAGCADVNRAIRSGKADFDAGAWEFSVATKREAFLEYNVDFIREADGDESNSYSIHWLPCANHVPLA